jgi:hypothetical protein
MADENDKNNLDDVALGGVAEEMAESRTAAPVRKTPRTRAAANSQFRVEDSVYNRNTGEHGLVRQVYQMDGITMYKVWLAAGPGLLRWGHFVSDWAEGVLELSDNLLLRSVPVNTESNAQNDSDNDDSKS